MAIVPAYNKTQSQIVSGELQGVTGGRGELRYLGGETDTCVSVCSIGVCSFVNGSAHCSGYVVDCPSATYGCHLSIIIIIKNTILK